MIRHGTSGKTNWDPGGFHEFPHRFPTRVPPGGAGSPQDPDDVPWVPPALLGTLGTAGEFTPARPSATYRVVYNMLLPCVFIGVCMCVDLSMYVSI